MRKLAFVLAGFALVATACAKTGTVSGGSVATTAPPSSVSSGAAAAPTTTAKPSGVYAMGTSVTVAQTVDGITQVTVYGYYPNIQSTQPDVDQPPSGDSYSAIDAQECAGSAGASTGANENDFTVLLSNVSTAKMDSLVGNPTVSPLDTESELGSGSQGLSPNQCDRGWIVFDIPNGVTATYVQFTGTTAGASPNTVVKWTIS